MLRVAIEREVLRRKRELRELSDVKDRVADLPRVEAFADELDRRAHPHGREDLDRLGQDGALNNDPR